MDLIKFIIAPVRPLLLRPLTTEGIYYLPPFKRNIVSF